MESKRDICERTFAFAVRIVEICKELGDVQGVSRTLSAQLVRAGTSIGANVEEAQAGQSKPDFIAKMSIACKEARETHYWLRLLFATGLLQKEQAEGATDECNQLIAILTTIIKNARERK
jgi:four helix bundle protein